MTKKLTAIILAAGLASGCATTTNNYQYKGDHSRAYNLAQAGGLYDARDYDIPRDQRDGVISKGWDVSGDALLFNSGHGLGLDWGKSLGLGVLTSAFAPKGVIERDSVFGWLPETKAGNAREAWELMSSTLLDGIEKTLRQANVKYVVDNRNLHQDFPLMSEYIFSSVRIVDPEHGCPDWESANRDYDQSCYVATTVYAPTEEPRKVPDFLMAGQNGYGFYANDEADYSRIKVNIPKGSNLDKNQLLAGISHELPAWAFIFVASQKLNTDGYTAPVILTTGKAELFITPDQG
ncbi:hypothetical protein DY923_15620 [Salmonella enterica subsp. enterica serovar Montevideo]|uniref:hypothetical protein n=1 Tax=Shewanella algae TaxID=38313 RepID=UPI0012C16A88|nr:hypothetical protein [Salmonella enterica subsp. enterica serovar Montevideo]MBB7293306.1 hypothetical protein [Escherichia coli]EDO6330097.1 hypothetical protein [Salmonella enterica subsp. enterica serovar Montevideo]EEA5725136.1 hypothetical protein [Salmonella enterica subsp. enterica serovar Montevideo]EGO1903792.1 hypothetical protein [Salmonella enterica subsp. enterica serovar Montevideo]